MQTLLDLNLGYVTCDICGEGQNRITIWRDASASAHKAPFKVARKSQCYGNLDQAGMTRDEAVEWLEAQHFLVATRYARKTYLRFLKELRKGAHDPAEPTADTEVAPYPTRTVWVDTTSDYSVEAPRLSDLTPSYTISFDPSIYNTWNNVP